MIEPIEKREEQNNQWQRLDSEAIWESVLCEIESIENRF